MTKLWVTRGYCQILVTATTLFGRVDVMSGKGTNCAMYFPAETTL